MKRLSGFILIAVLFCVSAVTPALAADAAHAGQTPYMVIRFNPPDIDYAMPLYQAVSRALEVKQSAMFDIVAVAPRAPKSGRQSDYDGIAAKDVRKVLSTLHEIGLPASRITQSTAIDDVGVSEVRIYVH